MLVLADDDKTERILPDIEDNEEIESLIVRQTNRVENKIDSAMDTEEIVEVRDTCSKSVISEQNTENEVEIISELINYSKVSEKSEENERIDEDHEDEPQDLSISEVQSSSAKQVEAEHMNQLLDHVEAEFSNVELSREINEKNCDRIDENTKNILSSKIHHVEKPEDDESGSISYHKDTPEPIECKIILSHEESDASSIASSEPSNCDLEVRKITKSYKYKYSRSYPSSPVPTKHPRSHSRASLRSDLDGSIENLCSYPIGFEATTLQERLKDNYNDEDMEIEEPQHLPYMTHNGGIIVERTRSHTSLSTNVSGVSVLKARCSKVPGSPTSLQSGSSYGGIEEDEDDSDAGSCNSYHSNEKYDEEEDNIIKCEIECEEKQSIDCKGLLTNEILQQRRQQQDQPIAFTSHNLVTDSYSSAIFVADRQHQETSLLHQENYPVSTSTSQNLLNTSDGADPTTSTDSKSCASSNKSNVQKPSTEVLNINENAHAGPINVFEFDGLQIMVPSTFISDSSQKAVSGTSQQSIASSENGTGNDEEVKSVNMRADETMPPRGELSEQESNGCTEQSAWHVRNFYVY